jgi:hypothetical protein
MEQRPTVENPITPVPQAVAGAPAHPSLDQLPKTHPEMLVFSALPAADRCAAYLKSIRSMLVLFTVLAILGITATVIFAIMAIHAIDQTHTTTNPFG